MPSEDFERWRQEQRRLAEAKQLLAICEHAPGASPHELTELQAQVAALEVSVDSALSACLAGFKRQQRVLDQVGIHSGMTR